MAAGMTSRERFRRMYEHRDADRVPVIDSPWPATIERWRREGMPQDVSYVDFFGLDAVGKLWVDTSPRYEAKVVEETANYIIRTTEWGVTLRNWKHAASTPEFLDFTIVDRPSWEHAKARMTPTRDRVNWDWLAETYPVMRKRGQWIEADLWFGFDVTHSWMVGTERVLCALVEDPDWCRDMFSHELETCLALWDMVWDAGYRFDSVHWCDDMGYKGKQFFSPGMYRDIVKPVHRRAIDWAHEKGVRAHLHSCGDVRPFVPEFVEMGLDALNPLEVKAGMDPVALKKEYGRELVFRGGINAALWDQPEAIRADVERVVPAMKESGGYIWSTDHSVPSCVSLAEFRQVVDLAKRVGSYA